MKEVDLRETEESLSELIDNARRGEPSIITHQGRREAVVVSFEEWERLTQLPSFARLLMSAPLETDDLPDRDNTGLRDPKIFASLPS